MHVDDLAEACVYLMNHYSEELFINIGSGDEISIKELAMLVGEVVGYTGRLVFDKTKPDGTPRKLMDSSRLYNTGYKPKISLKQGLEIVYQEGLVNKIFE
jgi:GDP-L-fucose synthase